MKEVTTIISTEICLQLHVQCIWRTHNLCVIHTSLPTRCIHNQMASCALIYMIVQICKSWAMHHAHWGIWKPGHTNTSMRTLYCIYICCKLLRTIVHVLKWSHKHSYPHCICRCIHVIKLYLNVYSIHMLNAYTCTCLHTYLMTSSETKCCLDMRICLISILTTLDDTLSCTGREDCKKGGGDIEYMYAYMKIHTS